jgi:DNA-binding winged helix-turn-helix (wHTH) protein
MKIDDDIKCLAEFLLEIPATNNEVTTTIYSSNFTSRHSDAPCYQNPHSVQKMIDIGVLKLIESGEDGQPTPDASAIHYFNHYKVSFKPQDIRYYLAKLGSEHLDEITTISQKEIYQWKNLVLNISEYTLKYKENPSVKISPTREIKLLRLLISNQPDVVSYFKVAKEVGINVDDEAINQKTVDKEVSQDVQKIRQDLIDNFLIPAGMTNNEAKAMIVNVRNAGYKLG